jgi:hypothetical protein
MTLEQAKEFSAIYHHKFLVLQYMNQFIQDLVKRAEEHDNSKFSEEEFPGLVAAMDEIKQFPYGTPEYEAMRLKHQKTFMAHYRKNRHHPEHHSKGIEDMTLTDVVEMFCDWKAASMRAGNQGSMEGSIRIGAEKYNLHPVLVKILENTAKVYKL